ncbi:Alpha/Beta hydrolase protein [Aspergillus floccosus]
MPDPYHLISQSRFHRRLNVNTTYGPLNITFADIGCETGPALLFMPGMFASRYLGIPLHPLAERAGVRLLVVDRPGMGASTDVPLAQRVAVWTEIVPQFLAHLQIPRVSLVAHSAGTIYLLNTWAQCRELINPVIAVIAPWVDPTYSRVTAMRMAQYVPTKAFAFWNKIPRFVATQASPVLSASGALIRHISPSGSGDSQETAEDLSFLNENWRRVERDYGIPVLEQKELAQLAIRFMHAENTVGANSEAMQTLRKDGGSSWGVCPDYAECAKALATDGFTLRAYFAATDALVGKQGQKYFEECWKALGTEAISFASRTIDGSDHDTVMQSVEVWEDIFSAIKGPMTREIAHNW